MGGNIVKGPKADKLKQRLIEEGLLPAKSKSKEGDEQKLARLKQEREELVGKTTPSAIARRRELADEIGGLANKVKDEESFGKQIRKQFGLAPSVPTDLKDQLNALAGPTNRGLAKEWKVLDDEQKRLQKELDELVALRDKGKRPANVQNTGTLQDLRNKFLDEGIAAGKAKDDEAFGKAQSNFMRVQKELNRREKGEEAQAVSLKKEDEKVKEAQKKYADLMRKQQELVSQGKLTEAQEMQRNVNAARRAWEKANAPALNAAKAQLKKEAEEAPKGLGPRGTAELRKIDEKIESKTTAQMGDSNFNWNRSLTKDAERLGSGSYGTAIKDPNNVVVKRGEIGQNEAAIMQKAHELGLAPKVYAAQLDGPGNFDRNNRIGRMAMDLADGEPIGVRESKVVEKAYWGARAALHRGGIAHNDMHTQNVFVNKDGKGMFVDMGLAQDSPKAALAEAMGVFTKVPTGAVAKGGAGRGGDGDWQVRRWTNIGGEDFAVADRSGDERSVNYLLNRYPTAYKVYANKQKAIKKLRSFGLSNQDVAEVMRHGIRSEEYSFEQGAMGKLTNDQALQVINSLYNGI
jgi:hypothetical protein